MLQEQGFIKRRPRNMEGFVKPNTKIQRYADVNLAAGKELKSFKMIAGGEIYSPSSFFLFSPQFWQSTCRAKFQKAYTPEQLHLWKVWAFKDVSVGMYVAVNFEDEWHRGRILKADWNAKRPFTIRLIDFGEIVDARLSDIFYLADSCADEIEAAVECQLVVSRRIGPNPKPGIVRQSWEMIQRSAFRKMMFDREVEVTLLNTFVNEYGETVWQVTLNIIRCAGTGSETLNQFTPLSPGEIEKQLESALTDCIKGTYD